MILEIRCLPLGASSQVVITLPSPILIDATDGGQVIIVIEAAAHAGCAGLVIESATLCLLISRKVVLCSLPDLVVERARADFLLRTESCLLFTLAIAGVIKATDPLNTLQAAVLLQDTNPFRFNPEIFCPARIRRRRRRSGIGLCLHLRVEQSLLIKAQAFSFLDALNAPIFV